MTKFRRGFKTEAEKLALELRAEIRLGVHDRLDPFALASNLSIRVVSLASFVEHGVSPESIHHLRRVEPGAFSATTVLDGTRALIVYNCGHAATRVANSLAHEIAHIVLGHEVKSIGSFGCRRWDGVQEDEASWLGGCLLVPRDAALAIATRGTPINVAAVAFGVSEDLMRMRLNVTGALAQARRAHAARGRRNG